MNKRRFIDVMTVVSCLAVVMLHTNNVFLQHPSGVLLWKTAFWHELFIFGAPAFFMISGATLMEYRERYDTLTFFKKRFRRAVVPFVLWSLIAFGVHAIMAGGTSLKELALLPLKICSCDYLSIYWFFMAIFMGYLFMPVMSLMAGRMKLIAYVLSVWFAIESLYPFVFHNLGLSTCSRLSFPFVGGAVFYMLLGYWLFKAEFGRRTRLFIYALGVGVFGLCFCRDVFHLPRLAGGGYWSPLCIIYSAAVFLWLRNRDYSRMFKWLSAVIDWIKPHTLAIYLMHGFVTDIAAPALNLPIGAFWYRMILPFVLIFACAAVARGVRRFEGLKV